tara:strand:- start:273 stop:695 length:423 start_codon:yes stop_codon:yes gene_type:complete
MFITCSSCDSKYLVNSADLKPNGRNVKCAKCGHNWFQTALIEPIDLDFDSSTSSVEENNTLNQEKKTSQLPSTYVQEKESSLINSILLVFFLILFIFLFWYFKGNGLNVFVVLKFYISEFYFNLQLIINDLANIAYKILN